MTATKIKTCGVDRPMDPDLSSPTAQSQRVATSFLRRFNLAIPLGKDDKGLRQGWQGCQSKSFFTQRNWCCIRDTVLSFSRALFVQLMPAHGFLGVSGTPAQEILRNLWRSFQRPARLHNLHKTVRRLEESFSLIAFVNHVQFPKNVPQSPGAC